MTGFGRIAYEAYSNHTGRKSLVTGADLPTWDELRPEIKAAWDVAAQAVLLASGRDEFGGRGQ